MLRNRNQNGFGVFSQKIQTLPVGAITQIWTKNVLLSVETSGNDLNDPKSIQRTPKRLRWLKVS